MLRPLIQFRPRLAQAAAKGHMLALTWGVVGQNPALQKGGATGIGGTTLQVKARLGCHAGAQAVQDPSAVALG
jgi:hypothetical protein